MPSMSFEHALGSAPEGKYTSLAITGKIDCPVTADRQSGECTKWSGNQVWNSQQRLGRDSRRCTDWQISSQGLALVGRQGQSEQFFPANIENEKLVSRQSEPLRGGQPFEDCTGPAVHFHHATLAGFAHITRAVGRYRHTGRTP